MKFIDHEIHVIPKGFGAISGRSVYRVYCVTCNEEVHPGTTAPSARVAEHMATCMECGYEAPFSHYGYVHSKKQCDFHKRKKNETR